MKTIKGGVADKAGIKYKPNVDLIALQNRGHYESGIIYSDPDKARTKNIEFEPLVRPDEKPQSIDGICEKTENGNYQTKKQKNY